MKTISTHELYSENIKGTRRLGDVSRCEENSKIFLRESGFEGVDWIQLAHESPMAGFSEYGYEIYGSIKAGNFYQLSNLQLFNTGRLILSLLVSYTF